MEIRDWLLLCVVLIALFGERLWRCYDKRKMKKEIHAIVKKHLEHLMSDLLRIRDVRNKGKTNNTDKICFDSTSFSEVNGYYFLFSDLLLRKLDQLELSKYPATIDFFKNYRINMDTIGNRVLEGETGFLTLATFNKLLEYLEDAIKECK